MKSICKACAAFGVVSAVMFGVFAGSAGAAVPLAASASAGCTPDTNIEAIIDDSGSMEVTDPNKLRVQAMDLLVKTLPATTTLGAVEFGSGFEGIPGIVEGT